MISEEDVELLNEQYKGYKISSIETHICDHAQVGNYYDSGVFLIFNVIDELTGKTLKLSIGGEDVRKDNSLFQFAIYNDKETNNLFYENNLINELIDDCVSYFVDILLENTDNESKFILENTINTNFPDYLYIVEKIEELANNFTEQINKEKIRMKYLKEKAREIIEEYFDELNLE